MIYKKPLCQDQIKKLVIAAFSGDVELKYFFLNNYQNPDYNWFFDPQRVQMLLNTFPPVWNFNPSHYKFTKTSSGTAEVYICGNINVKGYLEYYIGEIEVRQEQTV